MSKYYICPHYGERIKLNDKPKVSRKNKSADFFDAYNQDDDEIQKILRQKNIEFGEVVKNE